MYFEEFPPVADNRPTDSLWFHQLVDSSSTVDSPATAKMWPGAAEGECTLVIPGQRRPHPNS
ncbi:MAG TPA: hypothetical protein VG756_28800 [Pseudonocardiaceae bacterium]|jgi:hypothetical protein|nr:hypothetical protein [Pseudonocardiaceae bacterium]